MEKSVCFRYIVDGYAVSQACIIENRIDTSQAAEADVVYMDMDDEIIDKMIDMLKRLKSVI